MATAQMELQILAVVEVEQYVQLVVHLMAAMAVQVL
jgi:hypothetical protein